jgi:predicted transcriptional regulator
VPGAAFVGRGLNVLAEGLQYSQQQQDEIDLKLQAVKLDTRLDQLKEEIKAEPDFAQRDKLYAEKASEYLANTSAEIQSPRVRNQLASYYSIKFPREAFKTRVDNQKEWGFSRVAQTDMLGDVIADKIISTTDPQEAAKYRAMYNGQLEALSTGPFAPLNADQAQNKMAAWEKKVVAKRADAQRRNNPTAFLVDLAAGKYPELDLDMSLKMGQQARDQLDDMEKITERNTKKIKDAVDDEWSAQANFGQLDPVQLNDALAGKHPYISPDRARVLKGINENPPTGNGNQAAMTTWSQYLSSGRDLQRIAKTRAELNRIQADIGAPNKYIMDRLNELQSDQTTMENQAISRQANDIAAQNRGIASEINQYRADIAPVPAFVERLRPNTTAQDEAKIKAMYQKEGAEAAQKLREKLSKGAVSTYQATPPKMKNVQEYGE